MRKRGWIIVLSVIGIGIFVLWNGAIRSLCSELTYPFRRIGTWFQGEVSGRLGAAWRGLCDGPARMDAQEENERLLVVIQMMEAVVEENNELRQALDWKQTQHLPIVAAEVWGYGGGLGVWPRLTLGVGSAQGVKAGDAVVVREGLVGRVAPGVSPHTCEVILLSDPACRVAAEIPGRTKGIVQGTQGVDFGELPEENLLYVAHPLIMRYVGREVTLEPQTVILSEGSGERFPRGLVIGTVIEQRRGENDILSEVLVAPAVDPKTLRSVFILTQANTSTVEGPHGH